MYFRTLCLWLQRAGIAWRRKSTPEHVGHPEARAWQKFQQTLINVQNCCLMLFLTWNPQIDLCYRQSDYCALIQSKTLSVSKEITRAHFSVARRQILLFSKLLLPRCAPLRHVKSWQLIKERQSNSNREVFHKQASRYVVRHFQAKVSVHFNSPCSIVLVDIVNWFWKHLKAV